MVEKDEKRLYLLYSCGIKKNGELSVDKKRTIISDLFQILLPVLLIVAISGGILASTSDEVVSIDRFPLANKHYQKGKSAFANHSYRKAEKELDKCIELFPAHAQAHLLAAQLYYQQSRYEMAERHILAAKANYGKLLDILTDMRMYRSNRQKAERIMLRSALQQMESSYDQYDCKKGISRMMSSVQNQMDSIDSGELQKTASKRQIPADYWYIHGNILYKNKRFQEAIEQYNQTLEIAPYHSGALNNLCALYYITGQYSKAWQSIQNGKFGGASINEKLEASIREKCGPAAQRDSWGIEFPGGIRVFSNNTGSTDRPNFENTYIVINNKNNEAIIIDPGAVDPAIDEFVKATGLRVRMILNTHGHQDHIQANRYYADRFEVKIAGHHDDLPLFQMDDRKNEPDLYFSNENQLNVPGWSIEHIHTPGHTNGSVCFIINGNLFTGDTLFKNGIGNISAGSEEEELENTKLEIKYIKERLLTMEDTVRVFPGHGPSSTIGEEKKNNPFLSTANHSSQ